MIITDVFTITELSRLTKKSRPTWYSYLNDYCVGKYDNVPYSIIALFNMANTSSKADMISYCNKVYGSELVSKHDDGLLHQVFNLINDNYENLDLKRVKDFILEELKNDR